MARKRRPVGVRARGGVGTHWLAAFKYSLNTQKMQPGVGSGEAGWCGVGGEGAGGCGHALAAFKYSLNIQKMQPGVGSGEAEVVWCWR